MMKNLLRVRGVMMKKIREYAANVYMKSNSTLTEAFLGLLAVLTLTGAFLLICVLLSLGLAMFAMFGVALAIQQVVVNGAVTIKNWLKRLIS
jgi:hypothetical protein